MSENLQKQVVFLCSLRNSPNKTTNYLLFFVINLSITSIQKKPIKLMGFLLFMRYFVFTMILINVSSMNFANYIIVNSCKRPNQIHQKIRFLFFLMTTDIWNLSDVNHERKRTYLLNLCNLCSKKRRIY